MDLSGEIQTPEVPKELNLLELFHRCVHMEYIPKYIIAQLSPSTIAALRRTCKVIKEFIDYHSEALNFGRLKIRCVNEHLYTRVMRAWMAKFFDPAKEKQNKLVEFRDVCKTQYIVKLKIEGTVLTMHFLKRLIDEIELCDNHPNDNCKVSKLVIENCTLGNDLEDGQIFYQLVKCCKPCIIYMRNVENLGKYLSDIIAAIPSVDRTETWSDFRCVDCSNVGPIRLQYAQALDACTFVNDEKIREFS